MGKFTYAFWCLIFLAFPVSAEEIYCAHCKKHLYTTTYTIDEAVKSNIKVEAKDFIPMDGVLKPFSGMKFVCPFDGAPLNGYEYWFWSRSRKEPVMAYHALTLYVKDKDGEFMWYPHKVDLHD